MSDSYYLVVANQTLGGPHLDATIADRSHQGAKIHVVVPATTIEGYDGVAVAQHRLDEKLRRLASVGVAATGNVGPSDPIEAIRAELAEHSHVVGLLISTLPKPISRWLHLDLPHRAAREFGLVVEWVESTGDNDEPETVRITLPKN